jgi:hypothetical protein
MDIIPDSDPQKRANGSTLAGVCGRRPGPAHFLIEALIDGRAGPASAGLCSTAYINDPAETRVRSPISTSSRGSATTLRAGTRWRW